MAESWAVLKAERMDAMRAELWDALMVVSRAGQRAVWWVGLWVAATADRRAGDLGEHSAGLLDARRAALLVYKMVETKAAQWVDQMEL